MLRDGAVGRAFGDQMDNREFGIGEAVPTRSCARVRDDAPFHAQSAQRAADPAGIGNRFALDVGVECRVQLVERLSIALCANELGTGVLRSACVKKRARR